MREEVFWINLIRINVVLSNQWKILHEIFLVKIYDCCFKFYIVFHVIFFLFFFLVGRENSLSLWNKSPFFTKSSVLLVEIKKTTKERSFFSYVCFLIWCNYIWFINIINNKKAIKNSCLLIFQANFLIRVSRIDQDRCFKKHLPLELFIDH